MNVLTELRYAFYIAALTFIWLMLEYLAGLHDRYIDYHPVVTMFAVFIPIVFVYIGMRYKRDHDFDGTATWLQLFRTGIIITVCVALLAVPLQGAFHYFINPTFFDRMIEHAVERAASQNRDVTKAFNEAQANFNLTSYMMQSAIGIAVLGTLLSVIYSFLLRRRNINPTPVHPDEPVERLPMP